MEKYLILLAGGKGERMSNSLPKQFIKVAGKEIIFHTIDIFLSLIEKENLIVVLPKSQFNYWLQITAGTIYESMQTTLGGLTRFDSVKAGLAMIPNEGLVGIHDSVRPLVDLRTIKQTFELAESTGSAIPVISSNQSIRKIEGSSSLALNRSEYRLVQTPQCFLIERLKKAYTQDYDSKFTDDASVYESQGYQVSLCEGNQENIKITYPIDLDFMEFILSKGKS